MEQKYRIAVKLNEFSFEIEGSDLSWVEKKEKEYLNKFSEDHSLKKNQNQESETKKHPHHKEQAVPANLTINEFYNKYLKNGAIKSRPDIAVFFIYYLQKITKKQDIKTQDVTQCFADVGYPSYNKLNMTDILNQAKRKALVNYVNNFWALTITGEDFVLNTITGDENDQK